MLTSGVLSGSQEFLASWIAHDASKHGHYFNSRVPKMALYGAFVSAPLGHLLITILQKLFAGRTSVTAKVLQILVSNLIVCFLVPTLILIPEDITGQLTSSSLQVSPIQNVVYLSSMAVIAGARTFHQVRATVRAGFLPVMKVSWITSPLALAFAQKFLPEHTWVPFFNLIGFIIGLYVNTHTKKKRLEALRKVLSLSLFYPLSLVAILYSHFLTLPFHLCNSVMTMRGGTTAVAAVVANTAGESTVTLNTRRGIKSSPLAGHPLDDEPRLGGHKY